MLRRVEGWLRGLVRAKAPERHYGEDDTRLALAGLLVNVMTVDGAVGASERERLRIVLADEFGLKGGDLDLLIDDAVRAEAEAVDLYRFTSVLSRAYDPERRARAVERLWDLVYADGRAHEFEENLVWRVAELLGVARHERLRAKAAASRTASDRLGTEAGPDGRGGERLA